MAFGRGHLSECSLKVAEGFSCYEAALFVKNSICLQLQNYRVIFEDSMWFYGLQMDLEFIIFELFLVLFIWFGDLQESSEFWRLKSEAVSFNLGFSSLLR